MLGAMGGWLCLRSAGHLRLQGLWMVDPSDRVMRKKVRTLVLLILMLLGMMAAPLRCARAKRKGQLAVLEEPRVPCRRLSQSSTAEQQQQQHGMLDSAAAVDARLWYLRVRPLRLCLSVVETKEDRGGKEAQPQSIRSIDGAREAARTETTRPRRTEKVEASLSLGLLLSRNRSSTTFTSLRGQQPCRPLRNSKKHLYNPLASHRKLNNRRLPLLLPLSLPSPPIPPPPLLPLPFSTRRPQQQIASLRDRCPVQSAPS